MPTAYEAKVEALKEHMLEAVREHTDPERAAVHMLTAACPSCVSKDGDGAVTLRPPPSGQNALLAHAALAAALHLANQAAAQGVQVMSLRLGSSEQPAVAFLLDTVLWLCAHAPPLLDAGLPATCLEAVTEACTSTECEGIFAFLDARIAEFKLPALFARGKHTLLRTCTLALARMSKSHDAMLCGRVLMFLAKFLPLTERSGLNLSGAFNTAHATRLEDVPEGALDAEGRPVDANFYRTFWGLQELFASPPAALAPGKWAEISRSVGSVLDRLAAEKVTVSEGAAMDGGASVKFLSSARLLPLQLRDATFRRHFLVQCLVLMHWCEAPQLKEWAAQGLKDKALEDLQALRQRVYAVLEATPDKGHELATAVRQLLAGEDSWVAWKAAQCPPAPLTLLPAVPPPGMAGADIQAPRKRRKVSSETVYGVIVGTAELDRLWNVTEDNTSSLDADDRGGFRSLRQLMEPVMEEMREEAGGEEDGVKVSKDAVYSWKTLRMLARDSLPAFAEAVRQAGDLRVAARALYPTEVPPLPPPEEGEEEEEAAPAGGEAKEPKAEGEEAGTRGPQEGGASETEEQQQEGGAGEGEVAAEGGAEEGGAGAGMSPGGGRDAAAEEGEGEQLLQEGGGGGGEGAEQEQEEEERTS